IRIDLNQFKLHIDLKKRIELTLHFDSPSRRFYLSLIAFVVNEMKRLGKITSVPLEKNHELLVLLNDTVGGSAGSSDLENLQSRIYRKWKNALPNLEEAPLFKVLGRKKQYDEGVGKTYPFTDAEKDDWANLFEYIGSENNVRLKFALDKIGADLNDVDIIYEDSINGDAWDKFLSSLQKKVEKVPGTKAIQLISEAPEPPVSPPRRERRRLLQSRHHWIALIAVVITIGGAAAWGIRELAFEPDQANKASIERMAFPLPDAPSFAVMPFMNMSEDPKQEFLSDGITENIITALSKVPDLFVISRQSTFSYKGKPVKVSQVAEELGVRYVLEGSVQRSGDRIRITAQLIDALAGHHLWSERYERDLKDTFALQDEITLKIVNAVAKKVLIEDRLILGGQSEGKTSLDCFMKVNEGYRYIERPTIEDTRVARRLAEETIAMCPEVPGGYVLMGYVHYTEFRLRFWSQPDDSPQESIEKAIEMAQKALALDDSSSMAHSLLCTLYSRKREYDKAITEGERAVALDPSGAFVHEVYASVLMNADRSEEAVSMYRKAIRLNPRGATAATYHGFAAALWRTERFEEAVSAYKTAIQRAPDNIGAHCGLVAVYIWLGREKEARAEVEEVLRLNPQFSTENWGKQMAFTMKNQAQNNRFIDALRKAGLK
ncbi:MAG TPA: tetratricopeptide repeat protein, partial [Thermodesulfovibrionales bacterium]|nr:tetratricopeptide repeat protein [Thermodesulfovibrionales bacterium]